MILAMLLTRLYIAGILLFWLNALSTVIFSKSIKKGKLGILLTACVLSWIWPLALFSPEGRKRLLITSSIL